MSRKAIVAILAALAVIAAVAAVAVLAPKAVDGGGDAAPPALSISQPDAPPAPEPGQGGADEPADDGPEPCTFDAAYPLVQAITDGTYAFTQDGWDRLVADAGAISLTVDEESVKPPFVQYEARTMAAMKAFAAVNDDASFVKTGEGSWAVTVSVRRAASKVEWGDTVEHVRGNLERKLRTDGDPPEFRAQVTYTLEISGGKGTLRCTSPDWYL